jgi:superfamily II DNA or RNA helicase
VPIDPEPPFAAGDVVDVRGDRWFVEEAIAFADCTLLRLTSAGSGMGGRDCTLLHPFDRPTKQKLQHRVHVLTRRRWGHLLQSRLRDCRGLGHLRAAAPAAIDLLPFQLEPALAVVRGLASRLLLADEVGLGKTIQAGLVLAELQQRGWCDRALILTPAGLRDQWADELGRRFGIRAAILDAESLRAMSGTLPFGLNPWLVEPVVIASMDFVKQPEVLRASRSVLWDLLIIDEAHQVATARQRASAVRELANHARQLALLTATPHAGDEAAYNALCDIGRLDDEDDPILLFRRTRSEVEPSRLRRVHLLPVRLSADERHMHWLLESYVRRAWQLGRASDKPAVRLVATVLSKRALSSASSLAVSVERRLTLLSGRTPPPLQAGLPFDLEEDVADLDPALAAPIFDRVDEEQRALEQILAAAERARANERKVRVLQKILRRIHEAAVVFTEYRDTLLTLESAIRGLRRSVLLHGGLARHERRSAVEAFNHGAADVLLATDAGSEGLNLQSRCRLVINFELPWNPIRLEQRIGRVDRLGQRHPVHAINLFARDTAESTVLACLARRVEQIRQSLPSFENPVFLRTEAQIATEIFDDPHSSAAT